MLVETAIVANYVTYQLTSFYSTKITVGITRLAVYLK